MRGKAIGQRLGEHKDIEQIRADLDQRGRGLGHKLPETLGMVARDRAGRPSSLDISGQHVQHITKGQVGVADAGEDVTDPGGDDEIGVGLLGETGKLVDQHRLAAACLAGDEDRLPLSAQSFFEKPAQVSCAMLASNEDGPLPFAGFRLIRSNPSRRNEGNCAGNSEAVETSASENGSDTPSGCNACMARI